MTVGGEGMRLGLNLGYWGMGNDADNLALARIADECGYDIVWAAEAYGSDAATVLAWIAAQTRGIGLGSAVFQIPGRTPANAAMTAATLDTLSGGRFHLGLGVSGPQVSEGWHGVRFDRPLVRTREYVDIVRMALRREPVAYAGKFFTLPLPDGPGRSLRLTVHPVRPELPIYLAAIGPRNLELAGEIADGWLAVFLDPAHAAEQIDRIRVGRQRAGLDLAGFDIVPTVPVVLTDLGDPDLAAALAAVRNYCALYIGGMGSRDQNFYNAHAVRIGYADAAAEIQRLFLARDYLGAAAAVPEGLLHAVTLVGTCAEVSARIAEYAAVGVTTLTITVVNAAPHDRAATVVRMAELMGCSPRDPG